MKIKSERVYMCLQYWMYVQKIKHADSYNQSICTVWVSLTLYECVSMDDYTHI